MTAKKFISPAHWTMIEDAIREKRCVPFLGAAVNVSSAAHAYQGLPLGGDVALVMLGRLLAWEAGKPDELASVTIHQKLLEVSELHPDLTRTRLLDLPRVSLHYRKQTDEPQCLDLLIKLLERDDVLPSPILRALAALPLRLIVTTNYDRLMERALKDRAPCVVEQPVHGFEPHEQLDVQTRLSAFDGVIVYKIHGSIDSTAPKQPVVISEDDYIELLTNLNSERGVPKLIKEKLADATLLFLGYGLEDWDFRTLFRGLIEKLPPHQRRRAFALQKDPPEFWVDYWRSKGVEIYNVDIYQFAAELAARLPAYFPAPQAAETGQ